MKATEEIRARIKEYFGATLKDHEADILFALDYRDHFSVVQRLDRLHLKAVGTDEYKPKYSTECPICGEEILLNSDKHVKYYKCGHCGLTMKPIWTRRNL